MTKAQKNVITVNDLNRECKYSKEYNNIASVVDNIFALQKQIKELTQALNDDKAILKEYMIKNSIDKIIGPDYNSDITLTDVSVRKSINQKELEIKYNDIYHEFLQETLVDRSIRVKL